MELSSFIRNVVGGGLLVAISAPSFVAAQIEDSEPPWQPLIFSYDGGRIDLLEAVRLTLDNDPNLLLEEQDVRLQEGVVQELAGDFDWTLRGQLTWQHREQELLESTKKAEREKRQGFADAEVTFCQSERDLTTKVDDLRAAQTSPGVDIRTDQAFDATLRIIEAAILSADSAAEAAAIEQTRANLLQTELAATEEALNDAGAACQEAGAGLERLGQIPEEEEFDTGQLDLRLEKLTRSGVSWSPFLTGAYNSTEFIGKQSGFFVPFLDANGNPETSPSGIPLERLIDFGGKNIEDVYTFEVGFDVNVPLLRGRGQQATGAGERAAQIDYEASELFLEHSASESVLNTVLGYWNLVASQQQYEILQSSVDLQQQLVDVTQALIDAGEMPRVELARTQAALANVKAQLEGSARDRTGARMDLVRVIGLGVGDQQDAPMADGSFPPAPGRDDLARSAEAPLVAAALQNRLDIKASRSLVESGKVLSRAAVINLKPQFDISAGASSISRGEGGASEGTDNWASPSWKVGAFLEKPFGNNGARGRLLQRDAQLRQREISNADLGRVVRIGVVSTYASLIEALGELEFAEQAANSFEETYRAEVEKLQLGETTVLDTVLTEQQRTRSLLSLISVRLRVASLIARLRFETGTLIQQDPEGNQITLEQLTTLPRIDS